MADELGYFDDEGMSINFLPSRDLPPAVFLENGQADVALMPGSEVVQAVSSGIEIVYVHTALGEATEGIYTAVDGPDSLSEVDGRIGLTKEVDRGLVELGLSQAGLDPDQIDTLVLGDSPAVLAEALEDGTVDAVAGSLAEQLGLEAAGISTKNIAPEQFRATPADGHVVSAATLAGDLRCTTNFVRAFNKGVHGGLHSPEAVYAMAQETVPEDWTDPAQGQAMFDVTAPIYAETVTDESIGGIAVPAWEQLIEDKVAAGEIEEAVAVEDVVFDGITEQANDFDRAAVESDIEAWLGGQ